MVAFIYNVITFAFQTGTGTQGPPPPAGGTTRGPQAPIDENIWILIVIGILFGIYIIHKRSRTTNKAS